MIQLAWFILVFFYCNFTAVWRKNMRHTHTHSKLTHFMEWIFWIKKCLNGILMLLTFNWNKISSPRYYKYEFQTVKAPSRISLTKEPEAYSRFQSQHSLHSRFPAMRLGLGVESCFRFPWKCVSLSHMMPSRQNTGAELGQAACVNGGLEKPQMWGLAAHDVVRFNVRPCKNCDLLYLYLVRSDLCLCRWTIKVNKA